MLRVCILSQKSELAVFFLVQIVNDPLVLPDDINPQLKNLIEGLLCKGTQHSSFTGLTVYIIFGDVILSSS